MQSFIIRNMLWNRVIRDSIVYIKKVGIIKWLWFCLFREFFNEARKWPRSSSHYEYIYTISSKLYLYSTRIVHLSLIYFCNEIMTCIIAYYGILHWLKVNNYFNGFRVCICFCTKIDNIFCFCYIFHSPN